MNTPYIKLIQEDTEKHKRNLRSILSENHHTKQNFFLPFDLQYNKFLSNDALTMQKQQFLTLKLLNGRHFQTII